MDSIKVILCPDCEQCPAVEIGAEEVRIGEDQNVVVLTPAQWNDLVARIRAGELSEI